MKYEPTYRNFGDNSLLITWPAKIDPTLNDEVLKLDALITKVFKSKIIEIVPAYHSLAVYLKEGESVSNFIELLKKMPDSGIERSENVKRLLTIPVCYEPKYALDIAELAVAKNMTIKKVIELHTKDIYRVYFLGFLPGFPYLGGLNKKLHTPRKSTPRLQIQEGSVAIGGKQTGIYTIDSPGGWNVIGRSPLDFFSSEKSLRCLLKPGDFVRFTSISEKKYQQIKLEVSQGNFEIEKEVYHD